MHLVINVNVNSCTMQMKEATVFFFIQVRQHLSDNITMWFHLTKAMFQPKSINLFALEWMSWCRTSWCPAIKWNNLFLIGSVGSYKFIDEYNRIFIIYLHRLSMHWKNVFTRRVSLSAQFCAVLIHMWHAHANIDDESVKFYISGPL